MRRHRVTIPKTQVAAIPALDFKALTGDDKFTWRAVVINARFVDLNGDKIKFPLRQRLKMAYGWDIFFGKIPVLKVALIVNAAVTYGISRIV